MAVKTQFTPREIEEMLNVYSLGHVIEQKPISEGTVQSNYLLRTQAGNVVLRYYENRTQEQVTYEMELLHYLAQQEFPCAAPIKTNGGKLHCYRGKPYLVFPYLSGIHVVDPNERQLAEKIRWIARLGELTDSLHLKQEQNRLNYSVKTCADLAEQAAKRIGTQNAQHKRDWLLHQLTLLEFPEEMRKSVCHCDYAPSNLLYEGDRLNALIDFDDANYTFRFFDLISIMDFFVPGFNHETWSQYCLEDSILDFAQPKKLLKMFLKYTQIPLVDQRHFYDILKLSILFDCIWYFERGEVSDFFEKRKIDAINRMGREKFFASLFGSNQL
ncbi:MAG: homoserine kinase [Massiliimalia sp.]|jgi:homoserine kinase type II